MANPSPEYRVHVAVPTYGSTAAVCLLSFGIFVGNGVGAGQVAHVGEVDGAYIDRARNDLVRMAIANDSTHVMFVDQDMVIPANTLGRLLAHKAPVVGGSYWGKDDFFTPVAYHLDPFRRVYELEDCPAVATPAPELPDESLDCWCGRSDNHVHKIGGTGMGCTLVDIDLFRKVEAEFGDQLWFSSKETGEDVHFAQRCRKIGVDWLLDGFIQCGHVRSQIVSRQHYDWAKQHAPRCDRCGRVAFWRSGDDDNAEQAKRCWHHKEDLHGDAQRERHSDAR